MCYAALAARLTRYAALAARLNGVMHREIGLLFCVAYNCLLVANRVSCLYRKPLGFSVWARQQRTPSRAGVSFPA
jgi:hypothetical protein